jgi:type I restriction enzyme S subunit
MDDKDLPEGWTIAKIRDTAEYINGRGFKKSEWEGEGRPIIRIQNLTGTADDFNYTTLDVDEKYVIPPETILVSWSATLDAFRWHGPEAVLNQHIFKVVPNEDLVDEDFLFWLLKREIQEMQRSAKLQGSTMKHIRRDSFLDHEFPLPPLSEQRRIADRLDAIQSRTRRTRETLSGVPDRIEEYRQSVLNAAFTGQLTADWRDDHPDVEPAEALLERILEERRRQWEKDYRAKYEKKGKEPPSGWKSRYTEAIEPNISDDLPEVPDTWEWISLDQVLREDVRNGRSVRTKEGGFPVLRLNSIDGGYINTAYHKEGDWSRKEAEKFIIEEGDFYVSRGNGSLDLVGRGGLVDSTPMEVAFPDTIMRVRVNSDRYDLDFLRLVWDSRIVRRHIEAEARTSAGIYKINQSHLKNTVLPLPPEEEQQEIVRRVRQRLDKINEMATHIDGARERLDHLDRSVLAKAFRGELVETEAERARREDRDYETAAELLQRVRDGGQLAMEVE